MKIVRITEIEQRLYDEFSITFHEQGGQVIRSIWSPTYKLNIESSMHYSIKNIKQAAALEAYRVLRGSERLAEHWCQFLPE